jgi:uncharacterized protein (DUF58 family)
MSAPSAATPARAPRQKLEGDQRFLDPRVLARMDNLELIARFIVEGFLIGLHKSPYHGFSSEFSAYRKYAKGDPFKFIDWKAVAKTDRLYIKQFDDNTNTRTYLLLDGSASMAFGSGVDERGAPSKDKKGEGIAKWHYARCLAAALAHLMIHQGDAAGLAVFRDAVPTVLPARGGPAQLHALHSELGRAQPERGTDSKRGLAGLPERLARRGLVVLISDLLDDPERVIDALKGFRLRRHEVLVFHVLSPEERDFPYRDNLEFVDAETGQTLSAQASYIAEGYKRALNAHTDRLKLYCRQNDIDFVPLPTDEPLSTALLAFLAKREKMR